MSSATKVGAATTASVETQFFPPRGAVERDAQGRIIAYACGKCSARVETPYGVFSAMTRHVAVDECVGVRRFKLIRGGAR